MGVCDLAIVIVAFNSARYMEDCLSSVFAHAGPLHLDVVIVDVGEPDGTAEIVERFPGARLLRERNGGFAYANNRGLATCDARYVLFLNPDTKILHGSLSDLVARMESEPQLGLVGVRQVTRDGALDMTIRQFPSVSRGFGDALFAERLPRRPRWLGEREINLDAYDRDVECDWTSGSFMLARREAIASAGLMDERFFMYSEETDFCLRIRQAGWRIRHLPSMTILHYGAEIGVNPRIESAIAYSRLLYARKHFARTHRASYLATLLLRHALRATFTRSRNRRQASVAALKTLLHITPPPHAPWSSFSVSPQGLRPKLSSREADECLVRSTDQSSAQSWAC